jgi:hypothetical protein
MRAASEALVTQGARQLFAYWDSLPKVDFVPDRKDFNPAAIHKITPVVSLMEIISPDRVEIHLVGTDLTKRDDDANMARNYLDAIDPAARSDYLETLNTQITFPCGRRSILRTQDSNGLFARVEVLSLPISHALSGHPMILSCFEATENIDPQQNGRKTKGREDTIWIDIGAGAPAS